MSRFTTDPSLTGNLNAEYEALQNDLEQAKLLAADYQSQLSDKSNDHAALKFALEKTTGDLDKLQSHIVALRQERHNLANEVMKVVVLEAKLAAADAKLVAAEAKLTTSELKFTALNDELRRERASRRDSESRPPREGRREFIELGHEDPPPMTIIPTPTAPKPYQPRP